MRKGFAVGLLSGCVALGAAGETEPPVALSPGGPTEAVIGNNCPAFIWRAVTGAEFYELVVYTIKEDAEEAEIVLRESVPGSVESWTPKLERCLERGEQYAWTVRALGKELATDWSKPSLFEVIELDTSVGSSPTSGKGRTSDRPTQKRVDETDAEPLVRDPQRAGQRIMPVFGFITLDGRFVHSEDLAGKVVVLDFWGTWCAPCVYAVPGLVRLSNRTQNDPFVLISISSDRDDDIVRDFVAEHDMTSWTHTWDKNHALEDLFDVRSWPTYLIFDHEGVQVFREGGWTPSIELTLNETATRLIEAAK